MKHDILFMNDTVVNTLVGNDMKTVMEDISNCLSIFDKGDTINPTKCVLRWGKTPEDENVMGRINAMPGYVGGNVNVAGIKWIGSGPQNYKKGLPRASVLCVLNDPDTKLPLAIADSTVVSAKRTGAVGGLAVKYLARENIQTVLVCGAGAQGRTQLEAALLVRPGIKKVYIYDLFFERSEAFAKEMSEKLGVEVIPTKALEAAAREADVIITVTLANEPFIEADWLKAGSLMVQMADYEVTYDCVRKASKIVCDTWEGIKHRMISPIALMYDQGLLKDEDIYCELGGIINGRKPGRENDEEIIYFNAVGMGIEDLCIIAHAYRLAKEMGLGVTVNYWEK